MKGFVERRDWDDDLMRMRRNSHLRTRYVAVGVVVVSASLWGLTWLAWRFGPPLLEQLKGHFPWALSPFIAGAAGIAIFGLIQAGRFLHPYSDLTIVLSTGGGILLAAGIAAEWDGQTHFRQAINGWHAATQLAVGAIFVAVPFIAILLRRMHDWQWEELPYFTAALLGAALLLGPGIYVIGSWAWTEFDWSSIAAALGRFFAQAWLPIVLIGLLSAQVPSWVRHWRSRTRLGSALTSPKLSIERLALGAATIAAVTAWLLYEIPQALVPSTELTPVQYVASVTQERRTLLAVLAALGAGITLVYTHLRHQLERDANATGRYTEAVQQLGSDSMSIRLGGIYALARVARDSPSDAKTVTEVLAAFVRDGTRDSVRGAALDVVAAITELGRATSHSDIDEDDWQGDFVNLRSTRMVGGNLESVAFPFGADLWRSVLAEADLSRSTLRRAILDGSDLAETNFTGANLDFSSLVEVDATSASFAGASLSYTSLKRGKLLGTQFQRARLVGCNLVNADLTGANLTGANLEGADLRGADLTNAVLRRARIVNTLLYDATFDEDLLKTARRGKRGPIMTDPNSDDNARKRYRSWWANRPRYERKHDYYDLHGYPDSEEHS